MSHVTYMNTSRHTYGLARSLVTNRLLVRCERANESLSRVSIGWISSCFTRMNESSPAHKYIMSHAWMSGQSSHEPTLLTVCVCANERITWTNKMSCVMSHLWISHVLHMSMWRHTHKWVCGLVTDCVFLRFAFVQMSRITCTNEISWVMLHESVMSCIWVHHVTRMNECAV